MFIWTKSRMNKEAIFIEWIDCTKCRFLKPFAQSRAEDNGYEFQVVRFDDASVKEFDIQAVPMMILRIDGIVSEILSEENIVALISNQ